MYNPIAAEAMARALQADRLAEAEAARRARRARRGGRRHAVEIAAPDESLPSCG